MATKTAHIVHEFTLVLARVRRLTPAMADALYQIIDDGTAGSCNGEVMIDFHRSSKSLRSAVQSAAKDVAKAGFKVARVETEASRLVDQINETLA